MALRRRCMLLWLLYSLMSQGAASDSFLVVPACIVVLPMMQPAHAYYSLERTGVIRAYEHTAKGLSVKCR